MKLMNRELSWLSFNARVLQEALDPSVPVIERMRFLGIYSNNLDEFYRVRVAYIRRLMAIPDSTVAGFDGTPHELFDAIRTEVMRQQKKFQIAYSRILKQLEKDHIFHITEDDLSASDKEKLHHYFESKVKHEIVPIMLTKKIPFPELRDSRIYLAVAMRSQETGKTKFALVQIPNEFPRFYRLSDGEKNLIILLDDIVRLHLDSIFSIFNYDTIEAYTFKFTRDAELELDDDISVSFLDKIQKSIKKRKFGEPVRFVYDEKMPKDLLDYLLSELGLTYGVNTIPGGKYHNFKDFMSFPDFDKKTFVFPPLPPCKHPDLQGKTSLIKQIITKDILLHYPYQRFEYAVDLLREAAIDPKVKSIKINVYRVAKNSQIMNALINAVRNGKQVFVVLELQARFDEKNNVYWSKRLREAGAKVSFGITELKVHSKLIQIRRVGSKKEHLISYIGTGNFHEKTARIYEDLGLMTSHTKIGEEVSRVFDILDGFTNRLEFKHLFVSPFSTRKVIEEEINNEIANAKKGKPARIRIKINNLVDEKMIALLYKASKSGVKIDLLVRGICCLVPQIPDLSENITVRSIVGRFLEHSRIMIFENGGNPKSFIMSSDWMERNLDKRIEVGTQIYDKVLNHQILSIFDIYWSGNIKSRVIDKEQTNRYYHSEGRSINAQEEMYLFYKKKENQKIS